MVKRLIYVLMIIASLLIISFSTVYITREFTKVITFSSMGDMWSFLRLREDSPFARFAEVDINDFKSPPYPERGDILVNIAGLPSTLENYFSIFNVDTPVGKELVITYLHNNETFTTTVITRSIPVLMKLQIWVLVVLRTLIVVGLILVGLWGFLKRSHSSPVRTLTLFCYTLALSLTITSPAIADVYASFQIPVFVLILFMAFAFFTPAFWLKLHMLFPTRKSYYVKHRLFFNIILFLPGIAFGSVLVIATNSMDLATNIYQTLFLGLGYALLISNYRKAENFIEKRQTRLVLWGSAPGIMLSILFGWFAQYFGYLLVGLTFVTRMLLSNILFLLMLLIPISLAYAFGKYKLLSVEAKLKRGTRFIAVNLFLLLIFICFLYLFGNLILQHIGINSQTPTLILGLGLAFLFMPTQRKIRARLEKHFYPERVRLRTLLRDFLSSNIVRTDRDEFWKELEAKLIDGLSAERVYPVLRVGDKGSFAVGFDEPAPFDIRDEIVQKLEIGDNPILIDELIASGKIILSKEQKEWFLHRKSAILLPLITKSGLVGFLVISCKTTGEDFTAEELELLENFCAQTALVAENLELLGEKLEKEKLQEQMRVARDIQKGLLPGRIPDLPGLEVGALIRFCLEVAGDYYDIIPLDDNRTVLSIGDVAGKGVGAALLMANLQASLRTTQAMGVSLAESAEKINRLVFENTPSDMFITFFFVLVDSKKGILRYVNAGHNPPFLVTQKNSVQLLSKGGILFGVLEDALYTEGEIEFNPGDILLMYTDGVCEAMNLSEEEYGEKRLAKLVTGNRNLPLAELLQLIEDEVALFHGSTIYEDDFTLLAARLKHR
ncbi:MAG: SpoIIE family protein phosphatase [Candidatus Fermentibacteraceae bacterium]|nr:SpoIIE family protein phosphatase [Candidatus Fermentibacteraceae bacterium]